MNFGELPSNLVAYVKHSQFLICLTLDPTLSFCGKVGKIKTIHLSPFRQSRLMDYFFCLFRILAFFFIKELVLRVDKFYLSKEAKNSYRKGNPLKQSDRAMQSCAATGAFA